MPALGLSNKAVFEGDTQGQEEEEDQAVLTSKTQYPEVYFSPLDLQGMTLVSLEYQKFETTL